MRATQRRENKDRIRGFSLIELMVVVVMISLVLAAILSQVRQVQQRAAAEQGRVDDFQQARDFMAQIVRDGRQMGYPNVHSFDTTVGTWQNPLINDSRIATGIIRVTSTRLDLEGDVDGTGTVSIVSYAINGDGLCVTCMERAQVPKVNGNPLTEANAIAAASYVQLVQNVQNGANPVFAAFDALGNAIALPVDINASPTKVAQVRVLSVSLNVSNPTSIDPQTQRRLEADITGNIQVVNCSMAATQTQLQGAGVTIPGKVELTCQ
jgi:prepilin-type N-terminal cleavage/methylation domain-containing protein